MSVLRRQDNAARRAGDLTVADEVLSRALHACEQDLERAYVLRGMGELARQMHDLPSAQRHYQEAVALLRACQADPLKLAHSIRHLADVNAELGQNAEAGYREALALYRQHPAPDSP